MLHCRERRVDVLHLRDVVLECPHNDRLRLQGRVLLELQRRRVQGIARLRLVPDANDFAWLPTQRHWLRVELEHCHSPRRHWCLRTCWMQCLPNGSVVRGSACMPLVPVLFHRGWPVHCPAVRLLDRDGLLERQLVRVAGWRHGARHAAV